MLACQWCVVEPMKIAIIGTGISGLTVAYLLHQKHDISVYEANSYIGGHTATIDIELDGRMHAVDTGFIVFNDWTYPNFIKLMNKLEVEHKPTDMGFSVTSRHSVNEDFEYSGSSLGGLFADRRNLAKPVFIRMVMDIIRFGKKARNDIQSAQIPVGMTLEKYLDQGKYGELFRRRYILPMASAIWSASITQVMQFNAQFFVKFFHNHGLLNINDRPQWRVIKNGSRSYIDPLISGFRDRIQVGNAARAVRRTAKSITVSCSSGDEVYDQVVFACHSNQALDLLTNASPEEKQILGAIPYRKNDVVLHTDEMLLPKRKTAWASWNYLLDGNETRQPVLTYNMNMLQGIESERTVCVTMNGEQHIDQSKIVRRFSYAHPQFGAQSVAAQESWDKVNGVKNTWYCGAYWGNGFHEDGVNSALRVAGMLDGNIL